MIIMQDDATSFGHFQFSNSNSQVVNFRVGNGVPSFSCGSTPTLYLRADASTVSTVLYLCVSGTSWTAISVP